VTALAGFWSFAGGDRSRDCARMVAAQRIYASATPRFYSAATVSLGRSHSALVPEDRYDTGPAVSADGRRALVADVRLDNRDDLGVALGISPRERFLRSDASLVFDALERWEERALDRLVGDFAFAYWDGGRGRLLLARDFLGHRPLHYYSSSSCFAFASMPKGLHALEEIPRAPDEEAMKRFLALMPENGTSSFFQGVHRVPPAHYCLVTPEAVSLHRYWQPKCEPLKLRCSGEYQEAAREAFDCAVAAQLRGTERGVATHLSGGLDSSTVTATAARIVGTSRRIASFTAVPREGYQGEDQRGRFGNEGPIAAAVAAMYPQIEHVFVRSGHRSPVASLDRNFSLFERPFLNLVNGVWIDAIADQVRDRKLPVLLTGQRGNMSFSYTGLELLPQLLASGRLFRLGRFIRGATRNGISPEGAISQTIGPFLPAPLWNLINQLRGRGLRISDYSAIKPSALAGLEEAASEAGLDMSYRPRRDPVATRLWAFGRTDWGNYNKGYLGGWGIDIRDPTADRRLVELCLSIPAKEFFADGEPRALARRAFADRLPSSILRERRRGLQAVDWHEGLDAAREQVAQEVERLCGGDVAEKVLDTEFLRRLVQDWPETGWRSDRTMRLYRLALLRGVSAGHFLRKAAGLNT
jgi:asparagine synthase (glutamine-hydrolysing)